MMYVVVPSDYDTAKKATATRVIGANGALVGYGGGIKNKVALLEHERNFRR